jgi:phage-related protein (TIGR01555 family)
MTEKPRFRVRADYTPVRHLDTMAAALSSSCIIPGGFVNTTTGLGVAGLDPTVGLSYQAGRLPSAMAVDSLYTYDWLAARIIEKMPSLALVRGFLIKGADEEAESTLLREWRRLNYTDRFPKGVFQRGVFDGRAYGGAVLWIGYAQGMPHTPLQPGQEAGGVLFLDLFAQHELRVLTRVTDPRSPDFGMPAIYEVIGSATGPRHPRYGQIFHASRSVKFSGNPLRVPNTSMELIGEEPEIGVSVLTPVLDVCAQYGLAWRGVSNMLQDASIGVMKIAGLIEALASEDKAIIEDRLRTLQLTKSVHRMMFLDSEAGEEYERTEVSLSDIPETLQAFMLQAAGAADLPAKILFNTSPAGLNANSAGETDLKQMYDSCQEYRETYLGPRLEKLLTPLNGGKRVEIEWPSLWEASDNECAQTRLANANTDKAYWDMGYSAKDIGEARAKGTVIELTGKPPEDDRDDVAGAGAPAPGAGPQGAPGKALASKATTKQRAKAKKK